MTNQYKFIGSYQDVSGNFNIAIDERSGKIPFSDNSVKVLKYLKSQYSYFGEQAAIRINSVLEKKLISEDSLINLDDPSFREDMEAK